VPAITWLFTPIDHEIIRENVIKIEPIMEILFVLEPSSGGCDWEQCKYIILTGAIMFLFALLFFSILIPILFYLYFRQVFHVQSLFSVTTRKLFKMLTRALVFQAAYAFILVIIPTVFAGFLFFTHNLWGSFYSQLIFFPISLHSFCETFTLLYMIKPYREYVYEIFAIFMKKCFKKDINIINVMQYNSTTFVQ
jgi:hypothetical protein